MRQFLLGVPFLLLLVHGLIGSFTFLHWAFIVLLGLALIAPLFSNRDSEEEVRVVAFNEYAASLRRTQDAGSVQMARPNAKSKALYAKAKADEEKALAKLKSLGGFTSL